MMLKKKVTIIFLFISTIILNNKISIAQIIKNPGVYIKEKSVNLFSISEVKSAVPAFIGYTEKAIEKRINDLLFIPKKISSLSEYVRYYGLFADSDSFVLYHSIWLYFKNGGSDCYIVSVGNYNILQKSNFITGLKAIGQEDEPTLLLFPDAVNLSGNELYEVQKEALRQAATLKDRFCILDLKAASTSSEHTNAVNEFRRNIGTDNLKYGASYTPFLKLATPAISLPPSAAVAAQYCVVDKTRGVWKAPANISIKDIKALNYTINDSEQSILNVDANTGKSINAIRSFAGKGFLIWGARTLAGNDNEWRYVPVRRFVNMVEESITKSIQRFVIEPNDASTWVKIKMGIENYLNLKWRSGALSGSKPEHAYFVKVGLGTTMTSQDIIEKKMIIEIGMATTKPAEFIVTRIVLKMNN